MKNNMGVLLKMLYISHGRRNVLKYTTDRKQKNTIIAAYIGMIFLYLLLAFGCGAIAFGFGILGLGEAIPSFCAMILSFTLFIFSFFKVNGYLFAFRGYDMLMAMPFSVRSIAAAKFLLMYIGNLPALVSVSLPMLIVYEIFVSFSVWDIVAWLILTAVLPLIPMIAAAAIGAIIAKIGSGFRYKKLVQTILTFIFVIFMFCLRFIIEAVIRSDRVQEILDSFDSIADSFGKYYIPVRWFADAINNNSVSGFLLLIGVSLLLFEGFFFILKGSYRQINSALMTGEVRHKHSKGDSVYKQRSIVWSVAKKEWKRLTGSVIYSTNAAMGEVLVILLAIAALFVDIDSALATLTAGSLRTKESLIPAIPLAVYWVAGMMSTSACSPSLEGENYWIVKSLPIKKWDLYKGKLLFNLLLLTPPTIIGVLSISYAMKAGAVATILGVCSATFLCIFSSSYGLFCGTKFMKLDWTNEVEVVKQGAAVVLYMFPNMFGIMILIAVFIILSFIIPAYIVEIIVLCLSAGLAVLWYNITRWTLIKD